MAKTNTATTSKITEITTKVVKMLTPLDSEQRQKVIQASLTLLGEASIASGTSGGSRSPDGTGGTVGAPHGISGLSAKANAWVKRNGITLEQLEEVFDIAGGVMGVIASHIPGKNKKEKTLNAYVIQGVSRLLASGEGNFDDKAARALCENLGCYDSSNHAVYLNAKSNALTGSKDSGWRLTAPGLNRGAELVKEMTKGS